MGCILASDVDSVILLEDACGGDFLHLQIMNKKRLMRSEHAILNVLRMAPILFSKTESGRTTLGLLDILFWCVRMSFGHGIMQVLGLLLGMAFEAWMNELDLLRGGDEFWYFVVI